MIVPPPPEIAVVVIVSAGTVDRVPTFVRALSAQCAAPAQFELSWVLDAAASEGVALLARVQAAFDLAPGTGAFVHAPTLADAIARTASPWLAFRSLDQPLPADHFKRLRSSVGQPTAVKAAVVADAAAPVAGQAPVMAADELHTAPPAWHACLLRRAALDAAGLRADTRLRPELAADVLVWRALLLPGQLLAFAGGSEAGATAGASEPPAAVWRDRATYAAAVHHAFVEPLADAAAQRDRAPRWLQAAVLQHLSWYYTVDMRERAPTVIVDEPMAVVFHEAVRQALQHIDADTLQALPTAQASAEVRHALWSYQQPVGHSMPAADAYDHDQGLLRVTYWIHGNPPEERYVVDGQVTEPCFAKLRACNFFRRRLLRQRIAWLDVAGKRELRLQLNGREMELAKGPQPFSCFDAKRTAPPLPIDRVRVRFPPGKASLQQPLPPGWAGWKVRLVKALARFPLVRWYFRGAWAFVDRDADADDSAEHLYRWVRRHHPEVNAWYLLRPDSPDWSRLQAEGFRLVPPGLRRRLLALNCRHIVSSHTGHEFGLDAGRYGDRMNWRYSFLQHGVIKDDLSHWLGPPGFDLFVTSSPAEHASIVGDDTPYPYTDREVRRTGLPRHDRLRRFAIEAPTDESNILLVMPTWRGSLVDERMLAKTPAERLSAFAQSEYATRWRNLLNGDRLQARARAAGLRLAFMPHPNAVPLLEAFGIPPGTEVITASTSVIQNVFARTAAFITDYTSVAFTFAFLRRPVFYYQFDQRDFYSGGHNWRAGYFDYERDGFGPIAQTEADLITALDRFFERGCQMEPEYLSRMEGAMPDQDEQSCRRTYEAILSVRRPRAARGES